MDYSSVQSQDCSADQEAGEEAKTGEDDGQDSLSTIEEEGDAVPSGDMHHPILGMKSPLQGPPVLGDHLFLHLLY